MKNSPSSRRQLRWWDRDFISYGELQKRWKKKPASGLLQQSWWSVWPTNWVAEVDGGTEFEWEGDTPATTSGSSTATKRPRPLTHQVLERRHLGRKNAQLLLAQLPPSSATYFSFGSVGDRTTAAPETTVRFSSGGFFCPIPTNPASSVTHCNSAEPSGTVQGAGGRDGLVVDHLSDVLARHSYVDDVNMPLTVDDRGLSGYLRKKQHYHQPGVTKIQHRYYRQWPSRH